MKGFIYKEHLNSLYSGVIILIFFIFYSQFREGNASNILQSQQYMEEQQMSRSFQPNSSRKLNSPQELNSTEKSPLLSGQQFENHFQSDSFLWDQSHSPQKPQFSDARQLEHSFQSSQPLWEQGQEIDLIFQPYQSLGEDQFGQHLHSHPLFGEDQSGQYLYSHQFLREQQQSYLYTSPKKGQQQSYLYTSPKKGQQQPYLYTSPKKGQQLLQHMQFQDLQLPKHPSTLQPSALDYGARLPNQFSFELQSSPSFIANKKPMQSDSKNTDSKKRLPNSTSPPRNDSNKKQFLGEDEFTPHFQSEQFLRNRQQLYSNNSSQKAQQHLEHIQFQECQLSQHLSTFPSSALDFGGGLPNQFSFKLHSPSSTLANNKPIQSDHKNTDTKKRLPSPISHSRNDSNKKICLESVKLDMLSQTETLESLIGKTWDIKKKEIVKEYQDLLFLKIYKEFELNQIEDDEALKRKSQSMPGGYLKILTYHSSELSNNSNPKNYTDTELFSLYIMHATYLHGAKIHKGSIAIRKHEQSVREELNKRAKNNNPIALCCLGEVQKDENLLAKASQLGNLRARFQLARLLTNEGNSYVHDKVSLDWMADSPEFCSVNLELWLSLNKIINFKFNPTSISNGWILMKELEEQGNDKASFYMGKFYEHFGNFPKSNNCYVQSAKQKNENAQERLDDPDFKEACNLYSDALNDSVPDKSYKAQRKLGEFFFNGEKEHSIKNMLKIQINPFIAEYWLLLNAEKSPKNYYLLGEFFDNSYEDYVKAADKGYYKAQYILGKAFSGEVVEKILVNKDDQKALHYLLLSLKTIVNKINFKYKFEEKINLLDKKDCDGFVKREATQNMLFEVKNLIEKYFVVDNIHNNFFSYIIRHSSISTAKDLSAQQKNLIMLIKKQFLDIEKYISYSDNINSELNRYYEGKYEQSCAHIFSNHILTIIKKLKEFAFKISTSIERPGFFITCMKPINQQVQNFLESDNCPLRKTDWLFYPEDHQDLLESIKKIPDLLRDQEKINSYCINIIKNDEIYAKLFDDQELSLILKLSEYLPSKLSLDKHLSFTTTYIINSPIDIREEKRKEILKILNDNNIHFNESIKFFDNYTKLVLKILDETEYYRNSLFIRDNFLNIAINQ